MGKSPGRSVECRAVRLSLCRGLEPNRGLQDCHRGRSPLSKLPEYEIYAIRYAKQDKRAEGHMFLGGDHQKFIQGLDFFTYALKGGGRTWIIDTGMTSRQAKRMGRAYDFLCRPSEALAKIGITA